MSVNLGYACINMTLGDKGNVRTMLKKSWEKNGIKKASWCGVQNSETLCRVLEWNAAHDIRLFRMTSNLIPWMSEYQVEMLPDWHEIRTNLELAGELARQSGIRLSFHPGQFNCLGSPTELTGERSIVDLEHHGLIMDTMGLPQSHYAKINIHIGGVHGDKQATVDRWSRNFEKLSHSVRSRLTVENDDKANCYSTKDLHDLVYKRHGVPIVFDYHHHKFCTSGLSEVEALSLAVSTWGDVKPTCHYSESMAEKEGVKCTPQTHSEYIYDFIDDHGHDLDIMVESKGKELAVIKYRQQYLNKE